MYDCEECIVDEIVIEIDKLERELRNLRKTNSLLKKEIVYSQKSREKEYHYAGMYYQEKERNNSISFKELFVKKISTVFPQLIPRGKSNRNLT